MGDYEKAEVYLKVTNQTRLKTGFGAHINNRDLHVKRHGTRKKPDSEKGQKTN